MDSSSRRAADAYHALLRDEAGLVEELEARFLERMHEAGITFGGRVLCPFPRPNLVSPADYADIRAVCRGIFGAIEAVEHALGEALWDRVDLTPEERELVALEPGFSRSSPLSRLDAFLTPSSYQFVELNAETPAGTAYDEVLTDVFLELPVVQAFQRRWKLTRFRARDRVLEVMLRCYREAGGGEAHPTIAVVDYADVPTRSEHELFRAFFESRGHPSLVCDPRHLEYEGGRLRHDGRAIDIVYKRLLVNEYLERADELGALRQAVADGAVTMVNPFRCKPIHKKAIFAVLGDEEYAGLFDAAQRRAIATHVPWTRRVSESRTRYREREIDLPEFIRSHRDRLVLKPNDDYGGKGVFIGWEASEAEWDEALSTALESSYVVQERVELQREAFPVLDPGLEIRDMVVDLDPFVFDGEVEGFLTRLSSTSLANVTSGAGEVPSFLVEAR
jgi:hypothetical protein